jgi:tetratricopeptide (TPR) repeat protein
LLAAKLACAAGGTDARLSTATARCTDLAELIACGEALSIKPDDPDLLIAEGDALVQRNRPGEAIGVYRNALRHGAASAAVTSRIAAASTQRRSLLALCLTHEGTDAERACEAAWLPGASDEVAVFKRRGQLLRAQDHTSAALEAYLAAARLKPQDRSVAQAVVALSAAGGRMDARTLATVGTAFMTLGRRARAIAAFRQALRLDPLLPGVQERLRLAEHPASGVAEVAASGAAGAASGVADATIGTAPATVSGDTKLFTNEAEATRSN